MSSYTDVFGNQTLPPAQYGYSSLTLTANLAVVWPYNSDSAAKTLSKIVDIACASGNVLTLPDATQVSVGEDFLLRNVGSFALAIKNASGVQIATVAVGAASYFYLTDNTLVAGVFGVIGFGVGTSTADAGSLVGYGVKAVGASLNQSHPVIPVASSLTLDGAYRAKLVSFTGGTGTFNMTSAATLGDDYFVMIRNNGTGTLTLDPASAELVDGQSSLQLQPSESLMLISTGTQWYSVGYGRSTLYQFTQLTKDVSAGGTFTLSAAEASNKLLTFIGNPSSAVTVIVPAIVAVYYTYSNISTAFSITVKTAAGSGTTVPQGARIVVICDGTNVMSAQSAVANSSVSLTDGSVAVPALFFSSQTNTGLYKYGTNGLGFSVNGVDIWRLTPAGAFLSIPLAVASGGTGASNLDGIVQKTSPTGSAILPSGTTAERDGTPGVGYTRFNATAGNLETWNGSAWAQAGNVTLTGTETLSNKTLDSTCNTSAAFKQMAGNLPTYGSELVSTTTTTIMLPGSAFAQNIAVTSGKRYLLKWSQTHSVADNGAIKPSLGAVVGGAHAYGTVASVAYMECVFTAAATGSISLSLAPIVTGYSGTGTITISALSCKEVLTVVPAIDVKKDYLGNVESETRITYSSGSPPSVGVGFGSLSLNKQDGVGGTNMPGSITTASGSGNTASGYYSLYSNTTGYYNNASGYYSLYYNTTGYGNTASGYASLYSNTTGYGNTASGYASLYYNTTGYGNTASGYASLYSNTTGYGNTASGYYSLYSNTTGYNNTASGYASLYSNTTGYGNTASGYASLFSNTTGYYNTASGYYSLYSNTTGYYNNASGYASLYSNTTGYNNTASGYGSLDQLATYTNCSGLGYQSQVTGSNQVQLGNSATTTYVYGTVQNRSDLRDKADVSDTSLGLDFIMSLRPVDYRWDMREDYRAQMPERGDLTDDEFAGVRAEWLESNKLKNIKRDGSKKRKRKHHGFIAQEVGDVISTAGVDFGGLQNHSISEGDDVLSIGYDEFIAPMVKAMQEQQTIILALAKRLEALEG